METLNRHVEGFNWLCRRLRLARTVPFESQSPKIARASKRVKARKTRDEKLELAMIRHISSDRSIFTEIGHIQLSSVF